jgi:hypothetical protein
MCRAVPVRGRGSKSPCHGAAVAAVLCALVLGATAGRAGAEPSVPWLPSASARHALQLLADEAGLDLPVSQWPLPAGAVLRALDALPAVLPPGAEAARSLLGRELQAQRVARLQLAVRSRADALVGYGDDATPGSAFAVRSAVAAGSAFALRVGARIEERAHADRSGVDGRLDDSAVVVEALGLQLRASSQRSWWSPGWQGALALGNNAPAFTGVGLQRASASTSGSPWLAWLGPWNFDIFVARTEDGDGFSSRPYLLANRLTFKPWPFIELGLTKTTQWGGQGRPQSWRSFVDAWLGAGLNTDADSSLAGDAANALAGFDLRLRCPFGVRCAGYGQWIGEDEASNLPSAYLNLWGVEAWSADGVHRWFAEYASTHCHQSVVRQPESGCAYRNHAYPQGWASAGRWIGHGAGPDSRLVTLGWLHASGASLRLHAGSVGSRVGSTSPTTDDPATSGRLVGVSARWHFAWSPGVSVAPEIDWLRVRAAQGRHSEARVGATVSVALGAAR